MARIKTFILAACDGVCIASHFFHVNAHLIRAYLTGRFPDSSLLDLDEPLEKTVERFSNGPN